MMHRFLMWLTKTRPMKRIMVNGGPYLERYFMGSVFGRDLWLHRFLLGDGDRHHHTHPWWAWSIVLCGWYVEHRFFDVGGSSVLHWRRRSPLSPPIRLKPTTRHRINSARPDTWTLMIVSKERLPVWHFVNPDGSVEAVESSPADWWKGAGMREER